MTINRAKATHLNLAVKVWALFYATFGKVRQAASLRLNINRYDGACA